jgi:glucosamine--fructose-6-phosphate aminotransferase (isomerizing)
VVTPDIQELKMNLEQLKREERSLHDERDEQPSVIKDTYRGRLHANERTYSNVRCGG